ncbi:MAG: UDP-N-acetylmuramoyl-L-alanyl-D-glutamate--2,6-diaminopimelate ligase [Planctomycetota bacterium]
MQLGELIDGLGVAVTHGDASAEIAGITDDSRRVEPGWAYVVRHAASKRQGELAGDNAGYADAAIAAGAAAVIDVRRAEGGGQTAEGRRDAAWEDGQSPMSHRRSAASSVPASPVTHDNQPSAFRPPPSALLRVQSLAGELAARYYGRPSEAIDVVGVTGTNGKTTVATLTRSLLRSAGIGCGLIGTIAVDTGEPGGPVEASLTTPGAIELQATLAAMRDHGLKAAAIEVSSHALEQGRADAASFAAGVFTNLSGDHLDYHGDMASYGDAKARLLGLIRAGGAAVTNLDDPWSGSLIDRVSRRVRAVSCSIGREADATVLVEAGDAGMRLTLRGAWGAAAADVPLVGEHNAMNVLQAAAAAWSVGRRHGMTADDLSRGLAKLPVVPGRLEPVRAGVGDAPMVLVDYAHTDDALDKALRAVRPIAAARGGRLWVVFGCGGDRDRWKRPRMMRVACGLAERVVVTSDNPRGEDPLTILDEVLTGRIDRDGLSVTAEVDRAAAIGLAVAGAEPSDVVLIAGKGHETYQLVGDRRLDFDDRVAAAVALADRRAKGVA